MATPYAMVPQPLPLEALLNRYLPPPPSTMTPGSAMAAPPGPAARLPGWGSLRALGAGLMNPLGLDVPVTHQIQDVPSLSGHDVLPTPVASADLGAAAAEDPAAAFIGQSVGLGPAFRLAGAGARAIAASPPAQWLGRQLARPAVQGGVTAPLALGGASLATAGDTQAPTALGPRTTEAQTALDAARGRLTELETRRKGLQTRFDRYDPENVSKLTADQIKEAQVALGATVDGKLGPQTRGLIARYRQMLQTQIDGLSPSETTIRADITKAEDQRTAAERLDLADAGRRALDESQPGWFQSIMPGIGSYLLGGVAGHWLRNRLAGGTVQRAETMKREVDAASARLGQGDLPTRISTLNELWTQGRPPTPFSRGTAPPFAMTPSGSPTLHTPSQVAPWASVTHEVAPGMMGGHMTRPVVPADQLYRPSLGTLYGPTAATMGIGGAESAASQFLMLPRAQQSLQEAQAALDAQGLTPENVARLRNAQQEVAFWTGMQNLGRGMALGGFGAEMTHPLRSLPRPSMAAAERERGALDMALYPRAAPPPAGPPPPAPVWDARVGRWRLNGGFVAAPLDAPRRGGS